MQITESCGDVFADLGVERPTDKELLAKANHMLRVRERQLVAAHKIWLRAAKAALAGDLRELRNRVYLAEAPPLDVVLSTPEQ